MDKRAEIKAMCSLPFPEALDNATSKSLPIAAFSFCIISSFNSNIGEFEFISKTMQFSDSVKDSVSLFFTIRILSQVPLFINAFSQIRFANVSKYSR